jgi:hypothetical protein
MRILLCSFLILSSACLARDFGRCVNGAVRRGDECVFEDAASPNDSGVDADADDSDGGPDPDASDASDPSNDGGTDGSVDMCNGPSECSADAPVCEDNTCSPCGTSDDCSRFASVARAACGPAGTCVECTANAHCLNPEKPVCGANNQCEGPCTSDLDCERPDGAAWATPHCELGEGVCVGCIPGALEVEHCEDPTPDDGVNAPACDPTTKTCTGRPRQSVFTCGACSSDTECAAADHRCIPTEFMGQPAGSFCLPVAATSCAGPLPELRAGSSTLGVSDNYCFPDAQRATCDAILDRAQECQTDDQCGAAGVEDGLCIGTTSKKCTYRCNGDDDCEGVSCIGPLGARYCDTN